MHNIKHVFFLFSKRSYHILESNYTNTLNYSKSSVQKTQNGENVTVTQVSNIFFIKLESTLLYILNYFEHLGLQDRLNSFEWGVNICAVQ